jgi:hypothetical protein
MKHLFFIVLLVAFTGCATGTHRQNHPALAIYAATVSAELPQEKHQAPAGASDSAAVSRPVDSLQPPPRRRLFRR